MIAPVWMAMPPEAHAAQISSGPGAGPLLSAAAAWRSLGSEYAATSTELGAALGAVGGGAWAGRAAEGYLAAHTPYLAWLAQAAAASTAVAAQVETAAASHTAALAAMPTLAELAANHATHATLVATNFFGVNTIPIALTEADYIRMWVQAATTMSTYQGVAGMALASAPPTAPAPPLLAPGAVGATALMQPAAAPTFHDPIEDLLSGSEHFSSMYRVLKELVTDPIGTVSQIIADFTASPAAAITTWMPLLYVFAYAAVFAVLGTPLYAAALGPLGLMAIPIALGLSGLSELVPGPADDLAAAVVEAPADQPPLVVTTAAPAAPAAAAPAPAPAPVAGAPAGGAVPAAPGADLVGYVVRGAGPGVGSGPALRHGAVAALPAAAGAPATATAGAAAGQRGRAKARGRRGVAVKSHAYRHEFLTGDADTPAAADREPAGVRASRNGTGHLGFAGTAAKPAADAPAGLRALAGDGFGNGVAVPMMPGSWVAEHDGDHRPDATA